MLTDLYSVSGVLDRPCYRESDKSPSLPSSLSGLFLLSSLSFLTFLQPLCTAVKRLVHLHIILHRHWNDVSLNCFLILVPGRIAVSWSVHSTLQSRSFDNSEISIPKHDMPLLLSLMVSHWQHGEVPLPSARITHINQNSLNFVTSGHFHLQHIFLRHLTFWKTKIHWNKSILYLRMFGRSLGAIVVNERWIFVSSTRFVAEAPVGKIANSADALGFPTPQILTLWDGRSSRPPSQSIWWVWNETRKSNSSPTGASIKGAVRKLCPESLFYTSINELTKPTECEEMTSMYCGAKLSVEVSMPSSYPWPVLSPNTALNLHRWWTEVVSAQRCKSSRFTL